MGEVPLQFPLVPEKEVIKYVNRSNSSLFWLLISLPPILKFNFVLVSLVIYESG